jgi:hypothetical protein
MDMTIGFFDYGAPVSIHAPPRGDVRDITKQAASPQ